MTVTNASLKKLIAFAYQVHDYQISGPDWLSSQRFDIQAEAPEWAKKEERPVILQNLLIDRFKLAVHHSTKSLPAYALAIAKGGPKLQAVDAHGTSGISSGRGNMTLQKASMQEIVDSLSRRLDRPVIDQTGLTGAFNGELHWTPDDDQADGNATAAAAADTGPSIFTALQEQFGLKLIPQKASVDFLIVDRVEKLPTAN